MTHVTTWDVFDQAYTHAKAMEEREMDLTGVPIPMAEKDIPPGHCIDDVYRQVGAVLYAISEGRRPPNDHIFTAIAHLVWLEQSLQEKEMARPETGAA